MAKFILELCQIQVVLIYSKNIINKILSFIVHIFHSYIYEKIFTFK